MNAKVLMAAIVGLVGLAASADVLYWQINNTEAAENTKGGDYAYAILRATDGAGKQYYVSENVDESGSTLGAAIAQDVFADSSYVGGVMDASKILSFDGSGTAYGSSGTSLSGLSFFVELYNGAGNWVGEVKPSPNTYQALVDSGTISGFNPGFQGMNAAMGGGSVGTYSSVPEPTSGLLMLIGMGVLALRRRKAA